MSSHMYYLLGWSMAAMALASAGSSLYSKPYPTSAPPPRSPVDLHIVQIDDFGTLWDAKVANDVLQEINRAAEASNVMVVLFIHGWHHNAAPDDPNLQSFRDTLRKLDEELNLSERRKVRGTLTSSEDVHLIGIYLGWRGRSLPGPLDYGTMWWRKSAAERVGDGDASEFIERLDRIYLRRNAAVIAHSNGSRQPLMGLVTIGHSFGGQVLLSSIARSLEYSLAERAPCTANVLNPAQPQHRREPEHTPVDSLGDLNILINPATEAYQFGRIDALYRQLNYPPQQTPQLVVFSADDDEARSFLFPIARTVTCPFRPRFRPDNGGYQSMLWNTALGDLPQQKTHDLNPSMEHDSLSRQDFDGADNSRKIIQFDFTGNEPHGNVVFSGVSLKPVESPVAGAPGAIPYSPVVVAVTHQDIIKGHDGIFRHSFIEFLVRYIGYVEGKRMLLRAQEHINLRSSPRRPTGDASTETCGQQ